MLQYHTQPSLEAETCVSPPYKASSGDVYYSSAECWTVERINN